MLFRELVHDPSFIFDGTNYVDWRFRMLNLFKDMSPIMKRIVDMGFPPPKDSQSLSLEDEENSYLNSLASHAIVYVLSDAVFE